MDSTDTTGTTARVGTLTVTVWPDTPLGDHQRYAYRLQDDTAGQAIEGRDLFTGAGAPVDPDRAIRDLAGYLGAAGEARQYALDHPGHTSEHEGLFPGWVAEVARHNADALAELTEHGLPAGADATEPRAARRWISVVFLQGDEADKALDLIDSAGTDAAIAHMAGYDYGEETTQAALENGYVYDTPPTGATDRVATGQGYALTYNPSLGHVGLLRELHTPPDPALADVHIPASARPAGPFTPRQNPASDGRDWFAAPQGTASPRGRGLSL